MNNEIKEILDRLFVYRNEEMKYQPEDILTINDVWLLLDYITNLQTSLDEAMEVFADYKLENANLQEENKRLKYENYKYDCALRMANINIKTLLNKTSDLQKKIDKAINYIEKYLHEHVIDEYPDEQSTFYDEEGRFIPNAKEELIKILKGKDKMEKEEIENIINYIESDIKILKELDKDEDTEKLIKEFKQYLEKYNKMLDEIC